MLKVIEQIIHFKEYFEKYLKNGTNHFLWFSVGIFFGIIQYA